MNEFLSTLLQAVIIAAVPICAGAAVKGVRAAVQYLASKSESEIAKKYLTDVADAISTAVTYTSRSSIKARPMQFRATPAPSMVMAPLSRSALTFASSPLACCCQKAPRSPRSSR